jgi:iron complex transport system permease protein
MFFGLPLLLVDGGAFAGALAATLLVFGLGHGEGAWTATRLLLTGVIVASGCGAVVALILTVAPDAQLRGMLFWLLGDLGHAGTPWPAAIILGLGVAVALPYARDLNVMARGELAARSLGVPVSRLRTGIQILASLLTATAVTTTGSVGFVGLVVPHLARLTIGNDQRLLLPAAALAGGTLLTLADTLARTIAAPVQLPVGALTALIGVPLFLYLLTRRGGLQ